jgi:FkbM family methyltransferase
MLQTVTDFTKNSRFELLRQLNSQLLKHPLDPSVTIKIQHDIGKQLLPEVSGRMIVPTAYGFPMLIDLETSHSPSMQGSIERNLYFLGTYEPGTLDIIRRSLTAWGDTATFIDIGAHNGLMSLYAAHVGANKIFSFEPNPAMFELMRENISLSSYTNIATFAVALGDQQRTVSLKTNNQNSGATHISDTTTASIHDIPMDTLDHIVQEQGIERVNLILIDIEDYEINALIGAEKVIAANRPDLIIEYNPSNQNQQVIDFLGKHNYKLYILENSRHIVSKLVPFRKRASTQSDNLFCFQSDRAIALGLGLGLDQA